MASSLAGAVDPLFVGYVAVFTAVALACFGSLSRARTIADTDTRRGLVALLLTSGGWASSHVGFLLAPTAGLKIAFYVVGLVIGLAAIGPWLYFSSAYTGRSLHRNATYQRVAVGVYLAIVLVKVTNPVHHLYFTTGTVATPFPHLAVEHQIAHWLVMGLAYALALVGYFMLFERFSQIGYRTTPLLGLVGVTSLPLVFDVVGFATPYLIDITYEPIGVAAFAIGILFVYVDRFQTIQVTGNRDNPVVLIGEDDRIREFNDRARSIVPGLDDAALGEPIDSVLPSVAEAMASEPPVLEVERGGDARYYRLSESVFTADQTRLGRVLVFDEVTEREQYRRELERQNHRLDQFASVVSHDLRNPLNVALARVNIEREQQDSEHLDAAVDALKHMEDINADVLALARQGKPIDDVAEVNLGTLAGECWEMVDAMDSEIRIEGNPTVCADHSRLQQLLENLFRNAIEHGGEDVTIRVGPLDGEGFYVADDGVGVPQADRSEVFENGYSTTTDGTGFGLAIVSEIAEAHDWEVTLTESEGGGARFEFTGVDRP